MGSYGVYQIIMKQTIYLSDGSVYETGSVPDPPDPPVGEQWFYCLPDFLMPPNAPDSPYPIRSAAVNLGGAPCVFVINNDGVYLDKEAQEFIARLMSVARYNKLWQPPAMPLNSLRFVPPLRMMILRTVEKIGNARRVIDPNGLTAEEREQIEKCFGGTLGKTVAIANGSGYPGPQNWVTLEDLTAERLKLDKGRLLGTVSYKGTKTLDDQSRPVLELDAFYNDESFPTVFDRSIFSSVEYGHKIGWLTIIKDKRLTKNPPTYAVNRFPRLDGGDVPFPLFRARGKQPLQYPLWYLEERSGPRPHAYWPPRDIVWGG